MACAGHGIHVVEGPDDSFCGEALRQESQCENAVDIVKVQNIPRLKLVAKLKAETVARN
jgi:hypothetical protein